MKEAELTSYRDDLVTKFEEPHIRKVSIEGPFKNAEKTGDRDAYGGVSWIDYWRAITKNHATTLYCSSCGKEIVVGEPTFFQRMNYAEKGETIGEHKAEGGHIWLEAPENADWKGGRYITPLCPACNAKRGQHITLKKGIVLCKEIEANTGANN